MELIRIENIKKSYKNNLILNNINFTIEKYKIYAIIGRSGAGKSTLLNILGLLDKADSGLITINGKPVENLNSKKQAYIRLNDIGFVFQSFYLNKSLKAYENIMVPMYINKKYKSLNLKKRSIDLLKKLGLQDKAEYFPTELSGGEQQRIAIARAIANDASCILADEPTGNLDKDNEKIVLEYFKKLASEGKAIVIVTHSESVLKYADKVYKIEDGHLEEQNYELYI